MQAIIFDMDGVLVDSETVSDHFHLDFLARKGHQLPANFFDQYRGFSSRMLWDDLIPKLGLDQTTEEVMLEARTEFMQVLESSPLYALQPGAREAIAALRAAGVPLAVASSASMERIRFSVARFGLADAFQSLTSGLEVPISKPKPDIYLLAAQRMGFQPEACLVFEDSPNGIRAALDAGMVCVRYTACVHDPEALHGAHARIATWAQATPAFLQGVFQGVRV
jgi:HAD superfamily hydrolase (TIGR01509 family)